MKAHSICRRHPLKAVSLATLGWCAMLGGALTQSQTAVKLAEYESKALQEVRINARTEKDVGFAPNQAQTAGKAPMRLLETPQSVGVVTREQMESRQITNLQQALQTVAGVSPVNFGRRRFDDVNIRGFLSSESILIDGLVQSPGMWTRQQDNGNDARMAAWIAKRTGTPVTRAALVIDGEGSAIVEEG